MSLAAALLALMASTADVQEPESAEPPVPPSTEALIDGRRRPDIRHDLPDPVNQVNPGAVRQPPPEAFPGAAGAPLAGALAAGLRAAGRFFSRTRSS